MSEIRVGVGVEFIARAIRAKRQSGIHSNTILALGSKVLLIIAELVRRPFGITARHLSQQLSSANIPNADSIHVLLTSLTVPSNEESLLRAEENVCHTSVLETKELGPFLSTPQNDALGVEGHEVSTLRGPLDLVVAPDLAGLLLSVAGIDDSRFRESSLADLGLLGITNGKLLVAQLVVQPGPKGSARGWRREGRTYGLFSIFTRGS